MEQARSNLEIKEFMGMVSNVDPHDIKPGASQIQVNVMSVRHGELVVRRGMRELTFDTE